MKKLLCAFIMLLAFNKVSSVDYVAFADRIVNKYCKELKREHGIHTGGYGGKMYGDIQEVSLYFDLRKELSIPEARRLYLNILNALIEKFNRDEKVRPYLHDYPFTFKNIKISLSFYDKQNKFLSEGKLAMICMARDNEIFYSGYNEKPTGMCFYDLYEETYEEAMAILAAEQVETPQNSTSNDCEN